MPRVRFYDAFVSQVLGGRLADHGGEDLHAASRSLPERASLAAVTGEASGITNGTNGLARAARRRRLLQASAREPGGAWMAWLVELNS